MIKWDQFIQDLKVLGIEETEDIADPAYLMLPKKESARWGIPLSSRKALQISLMLYSPSTFSGKIYKMYLKHCPIWLLKKIEHSDLVHFHWHENRFIQKDQCPAFFMGNGGPHSKVTIQMQDCSGPCAYLKYTHSPAISSLFQNETTVLQELEKCAPTLRVPRLVNQCDLGEVSVFQTSSVKSVHGKTVFDFTYRHIDFLTDLFHATKSVFLTIDCNFYSETKEKLEQVIEQNEGWRWLDSLFEECMMPLLTHKLLLACIHGDFTPWNLVMEHDILSCFDWEYSRRECLPVFDALHFMIQPGLLNPKIPLEKIWISVKQNERLVFYLKQIGYPACYMREYVMLYLIDILLFYSLRTEQHSDQERQLMNRWKALLHLLTERE